MISSIGPTVTRLFFPFLPLSRSPSGAGADDGLDKGVSSQASGDGHIYFVGSSTQGEGFSTPLY